MIQNEKMISEELTLIAVQLQKIVTKNEVLSELIEARTTNFEYRTESWKNSEDAVNYQNDTQLLREKYDKVNSFIEELTFSLQQVQEESDDDLSLDVSEFTLEEDSL